MTIQEFYKLNQVWKMFLSKNPMSDDELEFVCEQANMTVEHAKTVLHLMFGLWELSTEKMIELGL